MDGFCGAGGDSIQFAKVYEHVISNDLDPLKIELIKNNAKVYEVDNITYINSNFL